MADNLDIEGYSTILKGNIVECDRLIQKMLFETRDRKSVLYSEDLIRATADLMNARAAYAKQIMDENGWIGWM